MSVDTENPADWGDPTETHELTLAASDDGAAKENLVSGDPIQVTGLVIANWHGVSGCCDQSTVNSEWKKAFDSWVQSQKSAHATLRFVTAWWGEARGECRKWEDWPDGRRCNGSLKG